jgi:hypothetical protein
LWEEALITIIYSRAKKNAKEAARERERERGSRRGSDLFQCTVIGDVYPASTGTLE